MLGVVGSSLEMVKFEPTTPNMSQQGGQTHTCWTQQCCDMLRSFGRGFKGSNLDMHFWARYVSLCIIYFIHQKSNHKFLLISFSVIEDVVLIEIMK